MRNIILVIIFLMFLGCEKQNKETKFEDSKIKDINQIVEKIITQDSLDVSKNDRNSIAFCIGLRRINIQIPVKEEDNFPPIPFSSVPINHLLDYKVEKESFFLRADSIYIVSQNLGQKELHIEENILSKINLTTIEKETSKQKRGEKYSFYEMTIPVFSKDNIKAYVEMNHYCGSLCGSGKAYLLSKTNGKWRIIIKHGTWVS